MELIWHPATPQDIKLLTKTRIDILRAEHEIDENADMSEILVQTYEYYKEALTADSGTAYLVFDGEEVIGAGDIRFDRILPTRNNLTGKTAHIMNLYVHPDYRRQGVAYRTVALLMAEAAKRGISHITLQAPAESEPLFAGFGFKKTENHMVLQNQPDAQEEADAPVEEIVIEFPIQHTETEQE